MASLAFIVAIAAIAFITMATHTHAQAQSLASSPLPPSFSDSLGCTSLLFTRSSTARGLGGLATHAADCKQCDFRLALVAAQDYAPNATRPVYRFRLDYPRLVDADRSPVYSHGAAAQPIGFVKQVEHTFAYIDGVYGIINQFELAFGESTVPARLVARARRFPGDAGALFDVAELTRLALERCTTAREAIAMMGAMAEAEGYYGADGGEFGDFRSLAQAGEALSVSDANEGWIFHILPDDTGNSAVWAAQRVKDGHVAVLANAFTIGAIPTDDPDNFLYSANVFDVAKRAGLWRPEDGPFHFARAYGQKIDFEEIYCTRRIWRVFSLLAPSQSFPSDAPVSALPFSVRPDAPVNLTDIMRIHRDHYEGTPFDLTRGFAAGPFGSPVRHDRAPVDGADLAALNRGSFERAISLARTTYSYIAQSRSFADIPHSVAARILFAPAAPHASVYQPLYVNANALPAIYTTGSLNRLTRSSLWWAATAIGNYMQRNFGAMRGEVAARQSAIEDELAADGAAVEAKALELFTQEKDVKEYYTGVMQSQAESIIVKWWSLFDYLITRFHDGYRLDDFHAETIDPTPLFYPIEWLQQVGFFLGPIDWNKTDWQYTIPVNYSHPDQPSALVDIDGLAGKIQTNNQQTVKINDERAAAGSLDLADPATALMVAVAFPALFFLGQRIGVGSSKYWPVD